MGSWLKKRLRKPLRLKSHKFLGDTKSRLDAARKRAALKIREDKKWREKVCFVNLKAALLYVEGDILLSELVCVTDSLSDAVGRDAFLNADLLLAMSAQKKEEGTGRLFMWFR